MGSEHSMFCVQYVQSKLCKTGVEIRDKSMSFILPFLFSLLAFSHGGHLDSRYRDKVYVSAKSKEGMFYSYIFLIWYFYCTAP